MQEVGKPYPKDPRFIVYPDGNIRGVKGKIMKPSLDVHGYRHVMLGAVINEKLSRIVAITFIPNPLNYKCVNHKNGIKNDDRVENLEWCNHAQNMAHAKEMGLYQRGTKHYLSKLDSLQVKAIKQCLISGVSCRNIGNYFKVDRETIRAIQKGKSWSHVII